MHTIARCVRRTLRNTKWRLLPNMKQALLFLLLFISPLASSDEAKIAVAANFLGALQALAPVFEQQTGHRLLISSGSTGKLYAQIRNGAPYEVFLAADARHPRLIEEEGLAVSGSRGNYAVGRLVVWSAEPARVCASQQCLMQPDIRRLAIANPLAAPYGRAAQQSLEAMGVWAALQPRIVRGEDVGQTFQFVATGNAELGLVALSQVFSPNNTFSTRYWEIPQKFYDPIAQDMVLLKQGQSNPAARAFMEFIKTPLARGIIQRYGYGVK